MYRVLSERRQLPPASLLATPLEVLSRFYDANAHCSSGTRPTCLCFCCGVLPAVWMCIASNKTLGLVCSARTMCHHLSNMADHSRVHFLQLRLSKALLHLFHDFFTLIWPFVSSQKSPYFSRFPSFTDILTICLYDFNVCECSLKVWLDPLHPGYSCREQRTFPSLCLILRRM